MTVLLAVTGIVLIVLLAALRSHRQRQLANEGAVVRGRVIKQKLIPGKQPNTSSGTIRYEFITPRGKYIKNTVRVRDVVLINCTEGAAIDIAYLKGNPWTNDLKQSVDMSRAVLNLPPLSNIGFG